MVLKSILPRDLIGSQHNWRILLRSELPSVTPACRRS